MNGRVENDINIFSKIEEELVHYPEYVVSWYYYLKANEQEATTCRDYIRKITHYLKFINEDILKVKPTDLNENNIINYFLKIKYREDGSETSLSYKQSIWSCLNNFYMFMYKREYISTDYFNKAGVVRPKNKKNDLDKINKKRELLTQEDFKRILNAIDTGVGSKKAKTYQKTYHNRDKAIMLIFMTTGMRKTALSEINVEDIDFDKHELTIIDKGNKLHTYYLSDYVINVINDWMIDRYFLLGGRKATPLFISRDSNRMSGTSIVKLVDKYAYEALGYHISPHKLRSGLASILYEESKDIEYVRRVIGHSNATTTQRYIITDNKEREKAASFVCGLLE